MKKRLYLLLFSTFLTNAQTPTLVKDINPNGDSYPEFLDYTLANGSKLMIANDGVHGYEIWVTDGTNQGTQLLKDINPNGDAFEGTESIVFKDELYFFADDGVHGAELWKTNGTALGTKLVKDLKPNAGQNDPDETNFVIIGDKFYFVAEDNMHGKEVWVSDGSEQGTQMLVDMNPVGSINGNGIIHLLNINSSLVFTGVSGTKKALWKMSTSGDTSTLKNFETVEYLNNAMALNGKYYFSATEGFKSVLYVTDGTKEGTYLYKDINFYGKGYCILKNDLYFLADSGDGRTSTHLWKISGTNEQISRITKISKLKNTNELDIQLLNDHIFFFAEHDTLGYVLYSSDGSIQNTKVHYDFDERLTGDAEYYDAFSWIFNNELYISPQIDKTNAKLFKTNGQTVEFVHDFNPGEGDGAVWSFSTIKNELYMVADGKGIGYELFKYDGVTDTKDEVIKTQALIYPNPTNDLIYLNDIDDVKTIQITDLSGKLIRTYKNLEGTDAVDISSLDNGVYILEVDTQNKKMRSQRFVKN